MTDPNKVTLAECIAFAESLNFSQRRSLAIIDAILSHLRTLQGVEAGTHVVVPVELIAGLMWNDMQDTDADGCWHEQPEDMRAGWIKILPEYIAEEAARPGAQVRAYADTLSVGVVLRDEFFPAVQPKGAPE